MQVFQTENWVLWVHPTLVCMCLVLLFILRMLPDSGIDCIVSVSDAKRDTTKIVNALMVSTKFQEIVPTTTDDAIMNIECKHVYSGIAIHLIVAKECNTSFSGFIRYAKRIQGFKDLYICFRYFLKNNRIENDCNHTMVIYLLIIYYIQVTLGYCSFYHVTNRGHAEQVALGDMFLGLLDTIPKSSILMPSLSSSRSGLSFFGYLKSVQSKLNIHLDLTSKEAVRVFKVVIVCGPHYSESPCCVKMRAGRYIDLSTLHHMRDVLLRLYFMNHHGSLQPWPNRPSGYWFNLRMIASMKRWEERNRTTGFDSFSCFCVYCCLHLYSFSLFCIGDIRSQRRDLGHHKLFLGTILSLERLMYIGLFVS